MTLETAGIRLQKIWTLLSLEPSCSDPLHGLSDCKKYIEIAVRKQTQWKPADFAVKKFAVYKLMENSKPMARAAISSSTHRNFLKRHSLPTPCPR